ncbi:cyclic nucleotide-gated cation channel beta-3-like [Ornithodoros turicata]|uniref:cyclic nucleotide-gated cation channel beta-3-like n=1 Tax=Ornithodoros turicata TaxID=34597 RepID=UPI0031386957
MLDFLLRDFLANEKVVMSSVEPLVKVAIDERSRPKSFSPAGFQNPAFLDDDQFSVVRVSDTVQELVVSSNADSDRSDVGRFQDILAKHTSSSEDGHVRSESSRPDKETRSPAPCIGSEDVPRNLCVEQLQNHANVSRPSSLTTRQQLDPFLSDSERNSSFVSERIQHLVRAFSNRSQKVKERIAEAPTPSPSPPPEKRDEYESRLRLDSFSLIEDGPLGGSEEAQTAYLNFFCCRIKKSLHFPKTLDPQSKLYISWLFMVTLCYLYNCWAIFLRAVFYEPHHNTVGYLVVDYVSDAVYLLDVLVFKTRIKFHSGGMWVEDPKLTRKNYIRKLIFKVDVASLTPLDLLYFVYGVNPLLRLPRMLKVQTFWEFFNRIDALAKSPYIIRVLRTLLYMIYLIHLNACAYYAISKYEGIGSNPFVFQGGNKTAYVRCFYFAFKTATSIGKNAKPSNEGEYLYMTLSWLLGVFLFAFLIGQIRDIFATATQGRTQFRHTVDACVQQLRRLNLPEDLQRRVRLWLNHTWEQKKTLDESSILDTLPRKMKTDIAISVHYNTLAKVQFFQDCERSMLRDLVLKLKSILFLPGDYICRKGEIGTEMYIVNKGLINVMGGENNGVVLATLKEGSVFGEVSLLGLPGYNRRTADVLSVGFSNLFVLSKDDLNDVLRYYPDVEAMLRKKAKNQMKRNQASNERRIEENSKLHVEPIIRTPLPRPKTPKLVQTVIQVLRPESKNALRLAGKNHMYRSESRCQTSSEERATLPSPDRLSKPTSVTIEDESGTSREFQTYHDITQNALTLRACSALYKRNHVVQPPRCKSSPGDYRTQALHKETHGPGTSAMLRRKIGSPLRSLTEYLQRQRRKSRKRRPSGRSKVVPMEVDLNLKKSTESSKQTVKPPLSTAEHVESDQRSESTVSLGSLFASRESSDPKEDVRNYAADSEDETDREDFDFVSPVFLSSSSLSWNFDDLPR